MLQWTQKGDAMDQSRTGSHSACVSRLLSRYTALLVILTLGIIALIFRSIASDLLIGQTSSLGDEYHLLQTRSDYLRRSYERGRTRQLKGKSEALLSHEALGTNTFVYNRTIFGAMLTVGGVRDGHHKHVSQSSREGETLLAAAAAQASVTHLSDGSIAHSLPFPVIEWPHIITKVCPSQRFGHAHVHPKAVVAYDHHQIWLDFIFFDHDVIQALKRGEVKDQIYNSTSWSSFSGFYQALKDGTLYRNGLLFHEDDILVVLEDNIHIAVPNVTETLKAQLSNMTTDILYLGWRDGKTAGSVPIFSYAYAITRRGARIAVDYFDPCKPDLDDQFNRMVKHKWLSYRTAYPESNTNTSNTSKSDSAKYGDSKGIFLQEKM